MSFAEKWKPDLKIDAVIIPTGAMEAHGMHLPFTTDNIIPGGIAREVAKRTDSFLLPAIPYGNTQRLSNFKGTISVSGIALANFAKEILESAIEQGAKKIIIINGHDPNQLSLELAARDVIAKSKENVKIIVKSWWDLVPEQIIKEHNLKIRHSAKEETSLMMYLAGGKVDMDKTVEKGFVEENYVTKYYFNDGDVPAEGRPMDATPELGKKIFDVVVEGLVKIVNS